MAATLNIDVRGRCACGRRYRIRNAQADTAVNCPACGRALRVSLADIKSAISQAENAPVIPLHIDAIQPREAIPIDHGELTLASARARPGLTTRLAMPHEETMLHTAMYGWIHDAGRDSSSLPPSQKQLRARPARPFAEEMLASFYFAGDGRNGLALLTTAAACALPILMLVVVPNVIFRGVFIVVSLICIPVWAYIAHFYWAIMRQSAAGDDQLPASWVDPEWVSDGAKALVSTVLLAILCALPAAAFLILEPFIPVLSPYRLPGLVAAGLLGSLLWPAMTLALGVGGSLAGLRPDRIVRCIWACGWAYGLAWFTLVFTVAAGAMFVYAVAPVYFLLATIVPYVWGQLLLAAPMLVLAFALAFYFAYVHYRTIGLLARHFGHRFKWL